MSEELTLIAPIVPPSLISYSVALLLLDWRQAFIRVMLLGSDGAVSNVEWSGPQATAYMITLNKANLTIKSLHRRILEAAVADGKLTAGTVTGTPA